ncbi:DUF5661 family protein [Litoreibacter janthinus]|uniref:Uncharacterized protein n=1 Tax=Litoreibacter janthinus TaxID=670154 RepID=A0A1I6FPB4_9RHOB|nr:DUF5661 family protein [Litoreibacter janthinus]SFR31793.1 hypothetical protein SAMN04488002_0003 [Litoreibacter janthinus]
MPEYVFISDQQVSTDCEAIGLSDWSNRKDSRVEEREAEIIRQIIGDEALEIPLSEFRAGLEIELEHGTKFPTANVSGNHPVATGRIVLAHLKESLDYYLRLVCMELEMELTNALADGESERALVKRRDLAAARAVLEKKVLETLSGAS